MSRRKQVIVAGGIAAALALIGCHEPGYDHTDSDTHAAWDQQVAFGAEVFANRCARCHGDAGQGTRKAPALVGPGALPEYPPASRQVRTQEFHTAMDIARFVTHNMPPDRDRAEIPEREYWAVLAFALSANGIDRDAPVGPHNADEIVLHP